MKFVKNIFIVFTFILIIFSFEVNAQNKQLDSIINLYHSGKNTEIIDFFNSKNKNKEKYHPSIIDMVVRSMIYQKIDLNKTISDLEKKKNRNLEEQFLLTRLYYFNYKFPESILAFSNLEHLLKRNKLSSSDYEHWLKSAEQYKNAIDRMPAIKNITRNTYVKNAQNGFMADGGIFFLSFDDNGNPISDYKNLLVNRSIESEKIDNGNHILKQYDILDNRMELSTVDMSNIKDFSVPVLSNDGLELYLSHKNNDTFDDYDLYLSRYDIDDNRYMPAKGFALPYSSPYNDYAYFYNKDKNTHNIISDRFCSANEIALLSFEIDREPNLDSLNYEEKRQMAMMLNFQTKEPERPKVTCMDMLNAELKEELSIADFVIKNKNDFQSKEALQDYNLYKLSMSEIINSQTSLDNIIEKYRKENISEEEKQALSDKITHIRNNIKDLILKRDTHLLNAKNKEFLTRKNNK